MKNDHFWAGVVAGVILGLVGVVLLAVVTTSSSTDAEVKHFVELHREIPVGWHSTHVYVLRHSSGACFVATSDVSITQTDERVCAAYLKVEKPQ